MINKYPYTDFHELNLDWFLEEFKKVTDKVTTLDETVQQFTEFVTNYFDNLDVQTEINKKLNQMAADGTLSALLKPLVDEVKEDLDDEIADQNDRIILLESRMDSFVHLAEGSTTGDAELIDARIDVDGYTYTDAGDAIRGQVDNLREDLRTLGIAYLAHAREWRTGYYEPSTGGYTGSTTRVCNVLSLPVIPGKTYFVTDKTKHLKFRMSFMNSVDSLINTPSNQNWEEYKLFATAPSGAATVRISVAYPNNSSIVPGDCVNTVWGEFWNDHNYLMTPYVMHEGIVHYNHYNLLNGFQHGYVKSDGGIETAYGNAAIYTDLIEIMPGDSYTVETCYPFTGIAFSWHDNAGAFLSRDNFYVNSNFSQTATAPSGSVYMRISLLTWNGGDEITKDFLAITKTRVCNNTDLSEENLPHYGDALDYEARRILEQVKGRFAGKRLSILGDSISTYAGDNPSVDPDGHWISDGVWTYAGNHCRYPSTSVNNINMTYWMKLIANFNMVFGVNDSWAGSRVSWDGSVSPDQGASIYIASQARIDHLDDNGTPDVILIEAGTNDIGANVPVGTFNTDDPTNYTPAQIAALPVNTFADAYRALLIRVLKTYPLARVYVLLPDYTNGYYTPKKADPYLEIIKEACDYFGVTCVDMRANGINIYNTGTYTSDGIHPNRAGMQLLYEKAGQGMRFD